MSQLDANCLYLLPFTHVHAPHSHFSAPDSTASSRANPPAPYPFCHSSPSCAGVASFSGRLFFHSPLPPLFAAFFFCAHYTKKSLFIYSFLKLEQVSIEDPVPANIHPLSQQKQRLTQKGLEGEVLQVQEWEGGQALLRARIQVC